MCERGPGYGGWGAGEAAAGGRTLIPLIPSEFTLPKTRNTMRKKLCEICMAMRHIYRAYTLHYNPLKSLRYSGCRITYIM